MATYTPSAIVGRAETDFDYYGENKTTGDSEMGKEEFLTLLVAQLSNQDPLNPVEDKEFTAQLAEFSSLEQLTNISDGIEALGQANEMESMVSAVSFIGKDIRSKGDSISIDGDEVSSMYYELDEPISRGYINIFDSSGNLVVTEYLSASQAGFYEYQWNGQDYQGEELSDGVYYAYMAAEGANGEAVLVSTDVSGKVAGVQTINGTQYLRLTDGRMVNFMDIKEVVDPSSTNSEETTEE
ncbi:MAG: flagellar hook assembly protein FlgD [Desulfovibrio sp.]|nr:MAG: flagellar hook assembly protein FlgD [Desulfovibrio sp.]